MATVTCAYVINATGALTAAQIATLAPNVVPPPEFYTLTGATLTSNLAVAVGNVVTYTLVFADTSAQFKQQFPNSPLSPFWGLLTGPLQAYLNQPVLEQLPVAA
jgi:hypothetical protein